MLVVKKRKYNWPLLSFFVTASVLLVLSLLSSNRFQVQKNSSNWVTRTYEVKIKLQQLLNGIRDAESNARGYFLTSDSMFASQYLKSVSVIPGYMEELKTLVPVHNEEENYFNSIRLLTNTRTKELNLAFTSFPSISEKDLNKLLIRGKYLSDIVTAQVLQMQKLEDRLLYERFRNWEEQEANASQINFFLSLFSFIILIASFITMINERDHRHRSESIAGILEEKVKERTHEVEYKNRVLFQQNEELEKRNDELSSFNFIVNHDLKEPLRKIRIFYDRIEEIEGEEFSPTARVYFKKINESIVRMQNLLYDVYAYSTLNIPEKFIEVDLNIMLAKAVKTMEEDIQKQGALIEYSRLPKLIAIPDQIEQLFTNLLHNSLVFSRQDMQPIISISAEKANCINKPQSSCWKISFQDNGIGFDPSHKENIFRVFKKVHQGPKYSGTGMGLAICKKIVENHKGSIMASSRIGKGATITVFFPDNMNSTIAVAPPVQKIFA
ncbi:MAG TPA: ATP-binding protein [Flavisolibacter sp.]|nr:ATP-binding protein [Flavisolibacter sp.]